MELGNAYFVWSAEKCTREEECRSKISTTRCSDQFTLSTCCSLFLCSSSLISRSFLSATWQCSSWSLARWREIEHWVNSTLTWISREWRIKEISVIVRCNSWASCYMEFLGSSLLPFEIQLISPSIAGLRSTHLNTPLFFLLSRNSSRRLFWFTSLNWGNLSSNELKEIAIKAPFRTQVKKNKISKSCPWERLRASRWLTSWPFSNKLNSSRYPKWKREERRIITCPRESWDNSCPTVCSREEPLCLTRCHLTSWLD